LGGLAAQGFFIGGKTKFPQTGAWQTALLRTGFPRNLNRTESGKLMVYFQGLRLKGPIPRLWSGHPEAIQIAVHQSVEKIPEPSVTNRKLYQVSKRFSAATNNDAAARKSKRGTTFL